MNELSFSFGIATLVLLVLLSYPVQATGLYIDLPTYFPAIDTTGIELEIRHTDLQLATGRASILSGVLFLKPRPRLHVGLGLLYPVMVTERDITHAVGDGIVHATYRLTGDTLGVSGMFLRAYGRLPVGPERMNPFSYGSLDMGGGFEFRVATDLFRLRCAQTFTLIGERRKPAAVDSLHHPLSASLPSHDVTDFTHRNFFLFAASVEIDLRRSTVLGFAGYSFRYRGGDAREVYLLTVRQRLSRELEVYLNGGLDSGDDHERVFDSLLSVSLHYRWLPHEEKKHDE